MPVYRRPIGEVVSESPTPSVVAGPLPPFWRLFRCALLSAALLRVHSRPVVAQDLPPGSGFEWETLGALRSTPSSSRWLPTARTGAAECTLEYPSEFIGTTNPQTFGTRRQRVETVADGLAFLGPDTLLAHYARDVKRSLDGGQTWEETYRAGGEYLLHVAPLGLPSPVGASSSTSRGPTAWPTAPTGGGGSGPRPTTRPLRHRRHQRRDGARGHAGAARGAGAPGRHQRHRVLRRRGREVPPSAFWAINGTGAGRSSRRRARRDSTDSSPS